MHLQEEHEYPSSLVEDLDQWNMKTTDWLNRIAHANVPKRGSNEMKRWQPTTIPIEKTFLRLTAAHRAARELVKWPNQLKLNAFRRKTKALEQQKLSLSLDPQTALESIYAAITSYLRRAHRKLMANWKEKVKQWHPTKKEVHQYVRNKAPTAPLALMQGSMLTYHPPFLQQILKDYWSRIESWSSNNSYPATESWILDHYSLFVQNMPCWVMPDPLTLQETAKRMKVSSHGLDGWTLKQARLLPQDAWKELMSILTTKDSEHTSATLLYERIPIPKAQEASDPSQVRPVDLYSVLVRVSMSATC